MARMRGLLSSDGGCVDGEKRRRGRWTRGTFATYTRMVWAGGWRGWIKVLRTLSSVQHLHNFVLALTRD